jgi:hypothetical protein
MIFIVNLKVWIVIDIVIIKFNYLRFKVFLFDVQDNFFYYMFLFTFFLFFFFNFILLNIFNCFLDDIDLNLLLNVLFLLYLFRLLLYNIFTLVIVKLRYTVLIRSGYHRLIIVIRCTLKQIFVKLGLWILLLHMCDIHNLFG